MNASFVYLFSYILFSLSHCYWHYLFDIDSYGTIGYIPESKETPKHKMVVV